MCQFSAKADDFEFFDQNLPKNRFWGQNFKTLSRDSKTAPSRYHLCQFSVKIKNFDFFGLNLGKLPNYVQNFGSHNVKEIAKSRGEAEINWVEKNGDG